VHSKTALIESHFLPNLHYLSKCLNYDAIQIESKEFYEKRSYRNRSVLSSPNGSLNISVPLLKGKNNGLPIDQVLIAYHDNWEKKMCRAIQSSYGKTAFFIHYFEELESIILSQTPALLDLNTKILSWLLEAFQIDCRISFTENYLNKESKISALDDLRNLIHPTQHTTDPAFREIPYPQVFEAKTGFLKNISAIELLFTQGPQGIFHIDACASNL